MTSIRTTAIGGQPYFVGKDVPDILSYANTKDAISTHVDEEDKTIIQRSENTTFEIPNRGLTVINESGLYSLILSSKMPYAKSSSVGLQAKFSLLFVSMDFMLPMI